MPKNFTNYAFTPSVQELQTRYGSRAGYQSMAESGDRYVLGEKEYDFIQTRDTFYMATGGRNDWPYVQHRGGPAGFLKIVNPTTIRFADYSGNRQYISAGNVLDNEKTSLFLIDYPTKQRLKIWAHATVQFAEDVPELVADLADENYPVKIERVFTLEIQGFDWNCPKYITPRYTIEEIKSNPALLAAINA